MPCGPGQRKSARTPPLHPTQFEDTPSLDTTETIGRSPRMDRKQAFRRPVHQHQQHRSYMGEVSNYQLEGLISLLVRLRAQGGTVAASAAATRTAYMHDRTGYRSRLLLFHSRLILSQNSCTYPCVTEQRYNIWRQTQLNI